MFKKFLKFFAWFFLILALVAGGLFMLSYRAVKKSIGRTLYWPDVQQKIENNRTIFDIELHAQKISLTAADGVPLQGLLVIRKNAKRNFLVCHGYRGAKELLLDFAYMFPHDNFLFLDFRAHGQSGGNQITFGYKEKMDVLAAMDFLEHDARTKNLPLYGIGMSMGGVALLAAAVENPVFKGLVIDSAFARMDDQVMRSFNKKTGLPNYPFIIVSRWLFERLTDVPVYKVDAVRYLQSLRIPLLLVHSTGDTIVPVDDAQVLYEAAQGKKALWIEGPCEHAMLCGVYRDEYAAQMNNFFGF